MQEKVTGFFGRDCESLASSTVMVSQGSFGRLVDSHSASLVLLTFPYYVAWIRNSTKNTIAAQFF